MPLGRMQFYSEKDYLQWFEKQRRRENDSIRCFARYSGGHDYRERPEEMSRLAMG